MKEISSIAQYHSAIGNSDQLIVIDHYTSWCGACKTLIPVFQSLEERLKGLVLFYKVDIENVSSCVFDDISSLPTIKIFKNCQLIETIVGANQRKIINSIEKNI